MKMCCTLEWMSTDSVVGRWLVGRATLLGVGLCLVLPGVANAEAAVGETPLFRDPAQPVQKRVEDLISRLTLEEKATLLNHRGPEVERFGIKSDRWNQCLHGVWWDRPTTMFPVSIAMAATWDPLLVHQVATAISEFSANQPPARRNKNGHLLTAGRQALVLRREHAPFHRRTRRVRRPRRQLIGGHQGDGSV